MTMLLSQGTRLSEEAKLAAGEVADDGKAKLELLVVRKVLEALPLMYGEQQPPRPVAPLEHEAATALIGLGGETTS